MNTYVSLLYHCKTKAAIEEYFNKPDVYVDPTVEEILKSFNLNKLIQLNIDKYCFLLDMGLIGFSISEINQIFLKIMVVLLSITAKKMNIQITKENVEEFNRKYLNNINILHIITNELIAQMVTVTMSKKGFSYKLRTFGIVGLKTKKFMWSSNLFAVICKNTVGQERNQLIESYTKKFQSLNEKDSLIEFVEELWKISNELKDYFRSSIGLSTSKENLQKNIMLKYSLIAYDIYNLICFCNYLSVVNGSSMLFRDYMENLEDLLSRLLSKLGIAQKLKNNISVSFLENDVEVKNIEQIMNLVRAQSKIVKKNQKIIRISNESLDEIKMKMTSLLQVNTDLFKFCVLSESKFNKKLITPTLKKVLNELGIDYIPINSISIDHYEQIAQSRMIEKIKKGSWISLLPTKIQQSMEEEIKMSKQSADKENIIYLKYFIYFLDVLKIYCIKNENVVNDKNNDKKFNNFMKLK